QQLGVDALVAALQDFADALKVAGEGGLALIDGERRDALLARQAALAAVMPEAFSLDDDRAQRESIILVALLALVPGVRKVTVDRLHAAGLSTLEAMLLATPGDMAATTSIAEPLAARIVERFQQYAAETKSIPVDATRAHERARVAALAAQLRREHEEYERA